VDAQEFPEGVDVTLVEGAVTGNVPAKETLSADQQVIAGVRGTSRRKQGDSQGCSSSAAEARAPVARIHQSGLIPAGLSSAFESHSERHQRSVGRTKASGKSEREIRIRSLR
jgi:hypothetical protein